MQPPRGVDSPGQAGPYRLEEPIGRGGMGTVWRAWDERLRRRVAVKQIRADTSVQHVRERLRREAQAAARLNHPAIVHIYDIVEEAGGDWIVMELVNGQTLRQLLDEKGPLDPLLAARLGQEIAEGLAEAHELSLLHRDLKAANVMVTPAGRAKILDFGLAKEMPLAGADQEPTLSAPGTVLGTVYAMSPEQALGRELDARSDLFSLGALLYEALTGSPPFRDHSPTASLARILSFQPPPLQTVFPGFPPRFSDLVERLLEKQAAARPRGAREVAAILADLASGGGGFFTRASQPVSAASRVDEPTLATRAELPWAAGARRELEPGAAVSGSEQRGLLGERRVMTVVCCGLVALDEDSGEAGFLDPELLAESAAVFQGLAREVCERYSGRLESALGHLFWLYFGYPRAHENDVQLALRAARELVVRIGGSGPRLDSRGRQRLALRAAVHTGPGAVVAGRAGQEEQLQLGSVLDLATSLQNLAPVGQVVMSGVTLSLADRYFATEALPPVRVPGLAEPVTVYRVLGEVSPRDREVGPRAPLVGREREIDLLRDRYRLAREGTGQAILIVGEAGIGKSRLVAALRERLGDEDPAWWITYASPSTQSSPLAPITDLLDHLVSESGEASPGRKLDRLKELVGESPVPESVPLLASLLSLPAEGGQPPLALSPEAQRNQTFEALLTLITETAERRPLVLVIEDLHWVDASTLELLGLLCAEIAELPLLLLGTCRPEFKPSWETGDHMSHLVLNRLADRDSVALIDHLTRGAGIPAPVRQQILARTEGVPLFLEELTKAVLEAGGTGDPLDVPNTLGGSLAARFSRLGVGKEVAQVASVIGRTFSSELLKAIAPLETESVQRGLDQLAQAGLVHRRGVEPRARYTFKHALIQDSAYASLLAKDRQDLHLRIARALEEKLEKDGKLRQEAGEADLAPLAHHWSKAVDPWHPAPEVSLKAVGYLLAAGEHSLGLSAYPESFSHFTKGLEILKDLPESRQRDERELLVQTHLSTIAKVLRGWDSPEVKQAYDRARELCLLLGDRRELPQILFGLWSFHLMQADYEKSLQLAGEFLEGARQGEVFDLLMAHCATSNSLFWIARLPEALHHAEEVIRLATPEDHEAYRIRYGLDPRIHAGQMAVFALWHLGCEEEAVARHEALLRLAEELAHPFTLAIALSASVVLHQDRNDVPALLRSAESLIVLSREKGFPIYEMVGAIYLAWAQAQADPRPGVGGEALGLVEPLGGLGCVRRYGLWAGICLRTGRLEEALEGVAKGLEIATRNGEVAYESELYYLQGEILLRRAAGNDAEEAAAAFQRAFDLACRRSQVPFAERARRRLESLRGESDQDLAETVSRLRLETARRVREILAPSQNNE